MSRPLNVVIYTPGYDTGGQGWRIKQAFERYQAEGFVVRSIHTSGSYFAYPSDVASSEHEQVEALFRNADVIHMRNGFENLRRLRPEALEPSRQVGLVCHWHGTRFREEHGSLAEGAREVGAIQLVSTLDLAILEPNLTWVPSPVDLTYMSAVRARGIAAKRADAPIRLCHAPTNRVVKSTEAIMNSVAALAQLGEDVELDLIERKPWATVLERKAQADVYVDQLRLGYGNNAIEAWAMGIPVVAGVTDLAVRDLMVRTFGQLPFFEANEANLTERLRDIATDDTVRAQWGLLGLEHVQRFHDDRFVAALLADIYHQAYEKARAGGLSHAATN